MRNESQIFTLLGLSLLIPGIAIAGAYAAGTARASSASSANADASKQTALHNYVARGNALLARKQYRPAIDEYSKCFEIDPNNQVAKGNIALAHNNWGILYFSQKKYDEANAEWQQSLQIQPNQVSARRNLQILQATLDRLGLELDNAAAAAPADKGADAGAPDGAPAPDDGKGGPAKGKGGKGETAEDASGQPAGEPGAAGGPKGKVTSIKGSRKVTLTTGVNDQDSDQTVGESPFPSSKSPPSKQSPAKTSAAPTAPVAPAASGAPTTAVAPATAGQVGGSKKAPVGDAFDEAPANTATGQVMSYPSSMSGGAGQAPAQVPSTPGVMGSSPAQTPSTPGVMGSPPAPVQPAAQPVQQSPLSAEEQWAQQQAVQPGGPTQPAVQPVQAAQPQQPAAAQYDMDAAAQSSKFDSNGAAIYPPVQPAPQAEQVYENRDTGTSIKIISKPQEPVEVVAPQAVQQPEVVLPTPVQQPVAAPEAAPLVTGSPLNIDESLAALELKVFGKKQKSMPVLKRLEKLEIGTSGAASQGTVQERIEALRRAYGL